MIIISSWYRTSLPLEQPLLNLFFVSIIGYLSFIVAQNVRRQIEIIKEIDKAKSEFISAAIHQLRSPLSGTRWIIEAILGGDLGEISEKQREYFEELYRSNEKLRKFLNELLNIYKLESFHPKVNLTKINLKNLIEEIISRYSSLIEKKKLSINFKKEDIEITSDLTLLDLILDNLIVNALRYSFDNGKVFISVEKEKKSVKISVRDFGIGIPKSDQPKIFQKFYRAKNALRKEIEGSGLGLYLSKKATEILGGEIWFTSKEGEDSTFYLRLPLK